ncbi:hypothetical protein IGI04_035697 [Brassica rapa subsp. trilocularis]|uniref:Uncharacterized protein n=1 Tax=Brassica rapa subsp. trilocularis TaxID=1813537 RepID=A0ABQ7LCD1_BRACM|nr:hypothetical protein IGI04_035697 [Brassica rapa subsp. trilocularis]
MIRIRILGVDLILILRRMNWIENKKYENCIIFRNKVLASTDTLFCLPVLCKKFMAYNEILKTFEDQEELKEGYGNGEEACREDKEQRALHCPECMLNHSSLNKKNTQLRIFEWSYITVSSGISGLMLLSIYYRFHQRHIYKAKKEEDEHDNLKPASIAGGGNCSKS